MTKQKVQEEMTEDARCPGCGEKIDHLNVRSEEIVYYWFDHNGYEETDKEDMGEDMCFNCPECGECVAKTETEARNILFSE